MKNRIWSIFNKMKFIWEQFESGRIAKKNTPFLVSRWHVVEPSFKFLHKHKIHPYYSFPLRDKFVHSEFDITSGKIAKESNNPDKIFNQLINDSKKSSDEN